MEHIITCINCPAGCRMTVNLTNDGKFESVSGNTCKRGAIYAEQECTLPKRMITAVIPVQGRTKPLSVKTSSPVPKRLITQIMQELATVKATVPVSIGDVVYKNIHDTDVDIVATSEFE